MKTEIIIAALWLSVALSQTVAQSSQSGQKAGSSSGLQQSNKGGATSGGPSGARVILVGNGVLSLERLHP